MIKKQLSIFILFIFSCTIVYANPQAKKDYTSYLFVYFTGNSQDEEAIHFAISKDGYNYKALNGNKPIIDSKQISNMGGVRDPHILRGADGKTFYMVVTDMKSSLGWDSNHGMVLLKSSNLVDWTSSKIDVAAVFPKFKTINRVWAPQTIYDPAQKKYMVYWSMRSGSDPDVIYYSYANKDFTALETEPKILFSPGKSAIDADIILKDGKYNLFYKTEGNGNGIRRAVSNTLTGTYKVNEQYLQQTKESVEGSCVFKMIDSKKYILMYDMYTSGKYQFTESTDLKNFKVIDADISMDFHPRHGTVMTITDDEATRLISEWGTVESTSTDVKIRNLVVDKEHHQIYLPIKNSANIKALDPQLKGLSGVVVTPQGKQDFSQGAINYTFSIGAKKSVYAVTAHVDNNPALDGFYADPAIIFSHKTGKYYIYPTSDGFTNWSGTYFKTFSSDDLVHWKDEGVILDLKTDVSWADRNAWAPCMIEKKIGNDYKYFYYFCAAQKIGVATSDKPSGRFVDSGQPLISTKLGGAKGGQEIDPAVFQDPVSKKCYLYWGNGYLAVSQLSDDMISLKENTAKVITPDATFREGVDVFYRKGVYYVLWSEDDTRSPNYKVRYGTMNSPTGKITVPQNNIVIQKDPSKGIYGTGHHSVIQVPGTDEWYIVYHRFNRPNGITLGDAAGYNREVCIDKLEFNEDGSIRETKPTIEGIEAIKNK